MTEFVEVKAQDLSGPALDWAVAQVEGVKVTVNGEFSEKVFIGSKSGLIKGLYRPSTDWVLGGPLIDKFEVEILRAGSVIHAKRYGMTNSAGDGETALIAACRAIVASSLGDTVSVPKEIL